MKFWRAFGHGLLLFVVTLCTASWIGLMTLQLTIFNRQVVYSWLDKSNIYSNVFGALVQTESSGVVSATTLSAALKQTFPPSYVKAQTETALGGAYDWLEGRQTAVNFSVPVEQKQQEFIDNFAVALEPEVAKLPTCETHATENGQCLPKGASASGYAKELAKQTAEASGLLKEPITQDVFKNAGTTLPSTAALPYAQHVRSMLIALPIIALVAGGFYVLIGDSKLRASIVLGRRIFFNSLFTFVLGAALWYFGGTLQISGFIGGPAIAFTDPLIQQVLPAFGMWLTVLGGSVLAISGGLWLAASQLKRHFDAEAHARLIELSKPQDAPDPPPTTATI